MNAWRAARGHLVTMLVNVAVVGLTVWWLRAPPPGAVRVLPPPSPTPAPTATVAWLQVYVSGAVATQDVVRLGPGARVREAVMAAGGLTTAADRAAVNLAAPVADGDHLHVPARGEPPPPAATPAPAVAAARSATTTIAGAGNPTGGIMDLNQATAAELEQLPGIGPALAGRIVDYRGQHGPFRRVEDILAVPGVGEKTLARFVDQVTVR